jgi:photosystem II stability/assembly factor-like uncharacterized protein
MLRRLTVVPLLATTLAAQNVSPAVFDELQWRLIGPFRGGRVVAVTGVPGDQTTFYFGSVGGGVWKTTNAGVTWRPIFDNQHIASIGAIAVAASSPDTIYVGTGESDIRSQIGFGDGIYKSTDGGDTWTNIGLHDSRAISKILVDPRNPNRVFVAALGHQYGPNDERGVFRSIDGGQTWQKVLFTTGDVGAADLAWDPGNTAVLYATLWNAHRPPWSQYSPIEGPGSGLWKSTDGGDHWTQITGHGLPESQWHRAGIAVATGGRRVYALIDAQGGGLFRSDDSDQNWTRTSSDSRITSRGWYFGWVTVDPKNSDLVFVPNVAVYRSTDGGGSFTVMKGAPGGDDYHILWIDPTEPRRMVLGSDQGTNVSLDAGATWSTWYNQPTAQMYHAVTDNRFPYAVYGSQQDSGTAAVMSRTDHLTIDARDWFSVGGGESGNIVIDPKNDNILYTGNTNGQLSRFDRRSGQAQNITPWPLRSFRDSNSTQKYRFPWTAPLVFSPTDPTTIYYGAQYLLKTTDGGLSWKQISPDLTGDTRQDKTAAGSMPTPENARALGYGVIYSIAPSPLKSGMIWVASDTGLIHLTRDEGANWQNVTPSGLPDWSRVTQLEASHFDPATAYASVDRHRMEDYKPYIYRTRDYGKTWAPITTGLEEPAYVNCVREDPGRRGLLYAASELGVAISFEDGAHWQPLQLNLPTVSVRDVVVHGDDLVIATFGRGFWILDNITALRQIDDKVSAASAFLFKPATAYRTNPEGFFGTPIPVDEPQAKNPPSGAIIDYYFQFAPSGDVTLEILDSAGQVVRRYSNRDREMMSSRRPPAIADVWVQPPPRLGTRAGMNRFVWDLHYAAPNADAEGDDMGRPTPGPLVLPGSYHVRLTAAGQSYTQPLVVKLDPRSTATDAELKKQFDFSMECLREMNRVAGLQRAAGNSPTLAAVSRELTAALSTAQSADRTPPAAAYALLEQARMELSNLR